MYVTNHRKTFTGPVWVECPPGSLATVLKWDYHGDFMEPVFAVAMNGAQVGLTSETQFAFNGLIPGSSYRFDVMALSALEGSQDVGACFYSPAQGSRLKITIPQVDLAANPDFKSYLLYWSSDGSEPTTLLAELMGAGNTVFITDALADGTTYKFRVKLKDWVGNESAYGATTSGTVNTLPEAVEDAAIVYTQGTRKAAITATKPAGQDADVTAYILYSNHLPGYGLQSDIVDIPLKTWMPTDTPSYTTEELFAGLWKFAIRAVDLSGLQSGYTRLDLNLEMDGSNLVEIENPPAKPYFIDAAPLAGGIIRVTARIADPNGITQINFYRDGALDGTALCAAGVYEYSYDTAALADGQDYEFEAACLSESSIESELSETAMATADAAAPGGVGAVTLEVVA